MGDFNKYHLPFPSHVSVRYIPLIIESVGLHVVSVQATDHDIYGEDIWIDIVLTSAHFLVRIYGQLCALGYSHHDIIFLSYILKPPKSQPKTLHLLCSFGLSGSKSWEDNSIFIKGCFHSQR